MNNTHYYIFPIFYAPSFFTCYHIMLFQNVHGSRSDKITLPFCFLSFRRQEKPNFTTLYLHIYYNTLSLTTKMYITNNQFPLPHQSVFHETPIGCHVTQFMYKLHCRLRSQSHRIASHFRCLSRALGCYLYFRPAAYKP